MMNLNVIASRVCEVLDESGLNVTQMAKLLGVDRSTIYSWRKGEVKSMKSTMITKISDSFNVSIPWLLGENVPKEKETESHRSKRSKISDALYKVKESDLDKLLVIVSAFVGEELK